MHPQDFRPLLRLHSALDRLLAQTHAAWAVATVHCLGRNLRVNIAGDLGLTAPGSTNFLRGMGTALLTATAVNGGLSNGAGSGGGGGGGGVGVGLAVDREKLKPFKQAWMPREVAVESGGSDALLLDPTGPEDSFAASSFSSNGRSNGTAATAAATTTAATAATASAQSEHILVPARVCPSLASFLHCLSRHAHAAVLSVDTTMQTTLAGAGACSTGWDDAHSDGRLFAAANRSLSRSRSIEEGATPGSGPRAGPVEQVEEEEGGGASGAVSDSLVAVMLGCTPAQLDRQARFFGMSAEEVPQAHLSLMPVPPVLAFMAQRLLNHLALALVHYSYSAVLAAAKPLLAGGVSSSSSSSSSTTRRFWRRQRCKRYLTCKWWTALHSSGVYSLTPAPAAAPAMVR